MKKCQWAMERLENEAKTSIFIFIQESTMPTFLVVLLLSVFISAQAYAGDYGFETTK
jgi:hypothetical protein